MKKCEGESVGKIANSGGLEKTCGRQGRDQVLYWLRKVPKQSRIDSAPQNRYYAIHGLSDTANINTCFFKKCTVGWSQIEGVSRGSAPSNLKKMFFLLFYFYLRLEFQDQGYYKAKVLVISPTRGMTKQLVDKILKIIPEKYKVKTHF